MNGQKSRMTDGPKYFSGETVRAGDRVFCVAGRDGVIVELIYRDTQLAKEFECPNGGVIMIEYFDGKPGNRVMAIPEDEDWDEVKLVRRGEVPNEETARSASVSMNICERVRWAVSILLVGMALPSLLQLRIELRGGRAGVFEALRSVGAKWLLPLDNLLSVTLVCLAPFALLGACVLVCGRWCSMRATKRFAIAGLVLLLIVWIPLGIHYLKATYSDNATPFAIMQFVGLSLGSGVLLLALLPAFLVFGASGEDR